MSQVKIKTIKGIITFEIVNNCLLCINWGKIHIGNIVLKKPTVSHYQTLKIKDHKNRNWHILVESYSGNPIKTNNIKVTLTRIFPGTHKQDRYWTHVVIPIIVIEELGLVYV